MDERNKKKILKTYFYLNTVDEDKKKSNNIS